VNDAVAIPLGSWNFSTGQWAPNLLLRMTEDEQRAHNERNGYPTRNFIKSSTVEFTFE